MDNAENMTLESFYQDKEAIASSFGKAAENGGVMANKAVLALASIGFIGVAYSALTI